MARAQQPGMTVIGALHSGSPDAFAPFDAAFLQGLKVCSGIPIVSLRLATMVRFV